jgi:hypothetical protein
MSFLRGYKESTLKAQLKMAVTRFSMAANKKSALSKQQTGEIAKMLEEAPPKEEKARIKAEALIRDDNTIEAYEILELNCELLSERIRRISHGKGCPPDLVESVSTLIWASAIVGIPELVEIRKQFRYKYGKEFEEAALRNAGGVVNERVASKLSVQPPSSHLVQVYLETIADKHGVKWTPKVSPKASEMYEQTRVSVGESLPARGVTESIKPSAPPMPSSRNVDPLTMEGHFKHRFPEDIKEEDLFVPAKSTLPLGGKGGHDEHSDDDGDSDGDLTSLGCPIAATQIHNAPSMTSFSFKRPPFANDVPAPTSPGTPELRAGMVDPASQKAENDENLCIVCEESKKQVILLPCKHMCLCKNCAASCLFKTLNDCPMCRAKIEDSMDVFW